MPTLTDEQKEQLLAFMRTKWRNPECDRCDVNDWVVVDGFGRVSLHQPNAVVAPSSAYMPIAGLVCRNCGHTEFINTLIAGLEKPR